MKWLYSILLISWYCLRSFAVSYELPSHLNIARQENYPPYIYQENGDLVGVCIDLANAAFSTLGITVTYTEYPFVRMLKKAEWGQVDGVMMVFRTKEREDYLFYPEENLFYEHNSFFTKQTTVVNYFGQLESLAPYPIGVVLGFSYGEAFDQASFIKREQASNHELLLRQLRGGRFKVGLGNKYVVQFYADKIGFNDGITFLEPNVFDQEPLYLAFSKSKPEYEQLAIQFSLALEQIKASGEYDAILAKYNLIR